MKFDGETEKSKRLFNTQYLREKFNRIQDDRNDAISSVTQTSAIANVNIITNPIPPTSPQGNDEAAQHVPITVGQSISYIQDVSKRTIFGWDFQKNPMIFLSLGIYTVTAVLSSIGVFAISIVVFCKLHRTENYGKESMSEKSKDEQILLTKILMVTAYIPIILAGILGANCLVSFIRQKSIIQLFLTVPFQELLIGYIVPWIGITFPVFIILLIPALRVTTFLILTCQIWKENANTGDSDLNGNTINNSRMAVRETEADGRLSDDQLRALSNMTR
uniref:Uncharacterized protein n=1 Tax=Panagrolaimus davidi TaxID=227884 RepID=A0A914Q9Q4_9BILA